MDNRFKKINYSFSDEIATLKVTNQKSSGRCWIFAGLNVMREAVVKRFNLENFEISQNYVAFWDKLEKINYLLDSIMQTFQESAGSRIVSWILQTGIQDGGQWDMFTSIVEKYGIVPKDAMPETYHSSNTGSLNRVLNSKLHKDAAILRELFENGTAIEAIEARKEDMVCELYAILCMCFGEPPSSFIWEYKDKDGKFNRMKETTPIAFFKEYVGDDLGNYVSIINAPTADKPFDRAYTVKFLGNVVNGRPICYVNTDIKTLKDITLKQLLNHEVVWFGSDVGKGMDRDTGLLDDDLFDLDTAFKMDFTMTKGESLIYRESAMNHAMVITAVNLIDHIPNRWKIENSWGDEKGDKGYFVMTDSWFDRYVYQVVVHKKYLPENLIKAMEEETIVLHPWDPMGSLAR